MSGSIGGRRREGRRRICRAAAALFVLSASAPPADVAEIALDRYDPVVDVVVAGRPATLRVVFDVGLTVSPALAATLPVDWRGGAALDIGRVVVPRREAGATVAIAGTAHDMTLLAPDRACCGMRDGSIGIVDLPWRVVRIGRSTPWPERRYPMTVTAKGGVSIPWRIGGDTIHVVLAPDNPETVATAAAAALLARAYGGRLDAAVRAVPILYGIDRPVRDMRLGARLPLLGFAPDRIAVRTDDFAGARGVLAAADPGGDVPVQAGDIVVSHRAPPPQYRWAAVTIGRDLLDRCPQIAVYARSHEIGLSCTPG